MEALDLEVKRGESEQSHERSDLETTVAAEMVSGGDAKRPRKGNNDHHAMEVEEEEEDGEMGAYEIFEIHRKDWIASYGKNDAAAFYKPSTYFLCSFVCVHLSSLSSPSCCLISSFICFLDY